MTLRTRLFHRNANGAVARWSIWRNGKFSATVYRQWGLVGGTMQRTVEYCKAKRNKHPHEVAAEFMARHIKKKREEGFVEKAELVRGTNRIMHHDVTFASLPRSFAPQKPIQDPPSDPHDARFLIQRKRDGQRHYALVMPDGKVRLYSRTMHDMTRHMPLIVRAIEDMSLPVCTVIDGEIICDRAGRDDFRATNEVCRSLAARASFNERRLPIKFMAFDLLFFNGQPTWQEPYAERWERLITNISEEDADSRIIVPEAFLDFTRAKRMAERHHWEGLVLWDQYAANVLRMDGKPQRSGCYKWKPVKSGEFVAIGWEHGKGRLAKTMGKLIIAEYRGRTLIEICRVGSGFDNATRDAAMRWKYPLVVELKYAFQQEDTRALREPVFLRPRPDKKMKEMR